MLSKHGKGTWQRPQLRSDGLFFKIAKFRLSTWSVRVLYIEHIEPYECGKSEVSADKDSYSKGCANFLGCWRARMKNYRKKQLKKDKRKRKGSGARWRWQARRKQRVRREHRTGILEFTSDVPHTVEQMVECTRHRVQLHYQRYSGPFRLWLNSQHLNDLRKKQSKKLRNHRKTGAQEGMEAQAREHIRA